MQMLYLISGKHLKPIKSEVHIAMRAAWHPDKLKKKKSRIRETKHLSTDADSSTDAIGGWTKNTPNPDFSEKQKKIIQNA